MAPLKDEAKSLLSSGREGRDGIITAHTLGSSHWWTHRHSWCLTVYDSLSICFHHTASHKWCLKRQRWSDCYFWKVQYHKCYFFLERWHTTQLTALKLSTDNCEKSHQMDFQWRVFFITFFILSVYYFQESTFHMALVALYRLGKDPCWE